MMFELWVKRSLPLVRDDKEGEGIVISIGIGIAIGIGMDWEDGTANDMGSRGEEISPFQTVGL